MNPELAGRLLLVLDFILAVIVSHLLARYLLSL